MKLVSGLNIRRQLNLLLTVAAVLLLVLTAAAWQQFQRNDTLLRQLTSRSIPGVLAASELVANLQTLHFSVTRVVADPAPGALSAQQRSDVETARLAVLRQLAESELLAESAAQKGLLVQARESFDNYAAAVGQLIHLRETGQRQMAQALLEGVAVPYLHEFGAILETLRVEKRRSQAEAMEAVVSGLHLSLWVLAVSAFLSLALMVYLGIGISRHIRQRMQAAVEFAAQIAAGRLDHQLPIEARNQPDEIADLLAALESMRDSLAHQFSQLEQQARQLRATAVPRAAAETP
jgi:methyl-accepting chemotaxis protein